MLPASPISRKCMCVSTQVQGRCSCVSFLPNGYHIQSRSRIVRNRLIHHWQPKIETGNTKSSTRCFSIIFLSYSHLYITKNHEEMGYLSREKRVDAHSFVTKSHTRRSPLGCASNSILSLDQLINYYVLFNHSLRRLCIIIQ